MDLKKINQFFLRHTNINCGIIALIIVFYLLFVFPSGLKVLMRKIGECSLLKAQIVETEKNWKDIDKFRKQVSQVKRKIDFYEKKLPGEKDLPAILEYLSDAARELNVKITEIKPSEQDKDKSAQVSLYSETAILLKAECSYHQLGRFLNKLENADRFMKISDIEIIANPGTSGIVYAQLTVLTYVMKE